MAYIAKPRDTYSGVYEYLRERVDQTSDPSRCGRAFEAGEPVRVLGFMLPSELKGSDAYRRASHGVGRNGNPIRRSVVATVYPDSRVVYEAETAADWMAWFLPEDVCDWRDL
jgi:hypothetical protein